MNHNCRPRPPQAATILPATAAQANACGRAALGVVAPPAAVARRLPEAERLFTHALALAPGDLEATASLGWVRVRQGRVAEGKELIEAALRQCEPGAYAQAELWLTQIQTMGGA